MTALRWLAGCSPDTLLTQDYKYTRRGRCLGTAAWVIGAATFLIGLRIGVDASPIILTPLALTLLPAIWDLVFDPKATLSVNEGSVTWSTGKHEKSVPHASVFLVKLNTLWDFSTRTTFVLRDGSQIRVPPQCQPPAAELEAALLEHGLKVERHHFTRA